MISTRRTTAEASAATPAAGLEIADRPIGAERVRAAAALAGKTLATPELRVAA